MQKTENQSSFVMIKSLIIINFKTAWIKDIGVPRLYSKNRRRQCKETGI